MFKPPQFPSDGSDQEEKEPKKHRELGGMTFRANRDVYADDRPSLRNGSSFWGSKPKEEHLKCTVDVQSYDLFNHVHQNTSDEYSTDEEGLNLNWGAIEDPMADYREPEDHLDADDEGDITSDDSDEDGVEVIGLYDTVTFPKEVKLLEIPDMVRDPVTGEPPFVETLTVEEYRPLIKDLLKRPKRPFPKKWKPNPYYESPVEEPDPTMKLDTGDLKMPPDDFECEIATDPKDPNYLGFVDVAEPSLPWYKELKGVFTEDEESSRTETDSAFVTHSSEVYSSSCEYDSDQLSTCPEDKPLYPRKRYEEEDLPPKRHTPEEQIEKIPPGNPQVRIWYDDDANEYMDVLTSKGEWLTVEQIKVEYPPKPKHEEPYRDEYFTTYMKGLGDFAENKTGDQSYDINEFPHKPVTPEDFVIHEDIGKKPPDLVMNPNKCAKPKKPEHPVNSQKPSESAKPEFKESESAGIKTNTSDNKNLGNKDQVKRTTKGSKIFEKDKCFENTQSAKDGSFSNKDLKNVSVNPIKSNTVGNNEKHGTGIIQLDDGGDFHSESPSSDSVGENENPEHSEHIAESGEPRVNETLNKRDNGDQTKNCGAIDFIGDTTNKDSNTSSGSGADKQMENPGRSESFDQEQSFDETTYLHQDKVSSEKVGNYGHILNSKDSTTKHLECGDNLRHNLSPLGDGESSKPNDESGFVKNHHVTKTHVNNLTHFSVLETNEKEEITSDEDNVYPNKPIRSKEYYTDQKNIQTEVNDLEGNVTDLARMLFLDRSFLLFSAIKPNRTLSLMSFKSTHKDSGLNKKSFSLPFDAHQSKFKGPFRTCNNVNFTTSDHSNLSSHLAVYPTHINCLSERPGSQSKASPSFESSIVTEYMRRCTGSHLDLYSSDLFFRPLLVSM